jgi:5,10-methylenetetrahydromethanopterin reductase
MAAATVHDVSGGRMILGVGAGSPESGQVPAPLPPVRLTEAFVHVVRQVLDGRPVEGDEVFGSNGFRLGLRIPQPPPPIWLAALGDRMTALGGRVADGVLLNWCTPERVLAARRTLAEAADRAGRDPAAITVAVYVRACLGAEEDVAVGALRGMTGLYASIPHYLAQLEALGLGGEGRAAAAAHAAGRPQDVPASLVRTLTVIGGRAEAMARFEAFREAGADLILCYPVAALEPFSSILGTVLAAAPTPAVER